MLFSYNWLQSFFKKNLPKPEKLAELLTMHSFETTCQKSKVNSQESILDIDVLPNRAPDCFSHLGIAREISTILDRELSMPEKEKLKAEKEKKILPIDIKIKCLSLVPRYSAIVIEDVKIRPSPVWLREKLKTIGVRSINNIVDLTNFVMFEIGQPLHAFDYDKILGRKMILRKSKKGEKVITLDDRERVLNEGTLVIEDEKRLIDLVGVMGGKLSEIDSQTKNVVLQAGNFDRRTIYRTTKEVDQTTDASNIYTRGIDPNLTTFALERAHFLLKRLGGGKIVQIIDIYPKKVLPQKIKLDLDYLEKLLGIKISKIEIKNILKRLDFKLHQPRTGEIIVEVPTRRLDVSIPEDLIEEIGRIYGYDKIKAVFPIASLIPPKRNFNIFWEDMTKNIMKEAGFTEVYNYSFISEKDAKIFGYSTFKQPNLIEVENPTSDEFKYLRPSLIPNLLKNVPKNQPLTKLGGGDEIKLFELGKTFSGEQRAKNREQIKEKRMLTALFTGDAFYQAKGVVDMLLNKLGISSIWYDEYQPTPEESKISIWHLKKCAEIKIDHEEIGFLGEISPKIIENLKIEGGVVVFDIDFEKLQRLSSEETIYRPVSKFPAAVRDIAVLVPQEVRVEEVLNKIETTGGEMIRDVDLFDVYEGEELPEGKKNLAFHIIFQAEDRTLSSKEIDEFQDEIIKTLEENPEWEVRR